LRVAVNRTRNILNTVPQNVRFLTAMECLSQMTTDTCWVFFSHNSLLLTSFIIYNRIVLTTGFLNLSNTMDATSKAAATFSSRPYESKCNCYGGILGTIVRHLTDSLLFDNIFGIFKPLLIA
jgi:hypothetical protein